MRAMLAEHPEMPATVIAERVGWTGSITWFRDNVRAAAAGVSPPGSGGPVGVGGRVMRRSATCGSRRSGSRSRTARRRCCRCW